MIDATTRAGFTRTAAAHQPRRNSGNAQNVAAMSPTVPTTNHKVTTQSPRIGRRSAALSHGTSAYGNASALPCPITGMDHGMWWKCQIRSLTYHTWP